MADLTKIAMALLIMALQEGQKPESEDDPDDPLAQITVPPVSPEIRTVDRWGPS